MIGRSGERGSGISVLAARHDDDDDDISLTIQLERFDHLSVCKHDYFYQYDFTSHLLTQFKCQTVLFDQLIGNYQVLLLRVRVNMGAMAMKGYIIFSKAVSLKPHHQIADG